MNTFSTLVSLFSEGLLSFFSSCVLPLVPLYIGYLTQDAKTTDEEGNVKYSRVKVFVLTLFFILGICTVFFVAALGASAFKTFFQSYANVIALIGGVLLVFFGLFSLHIISIPSLDKTYRHDVKMKEGKMTFIRAYFLGFFFSFAWTPCIGPYLASAMVLAASASNAAISFSYIGVYALGFVIMFLLIGLFTEEVLNLLKKHRNVVKYTTIVGGIIIIVMGLYMIVSTSGKIASLESNTVAETASEETTTTESTLDIDKYGFTLTDSEGNEHTLSDYKGKTILITFYRTWCHYCNQELPILQDIHDTKEDIEVFLITTPSDGSELDEAGVKKYMEDAGYSLTVLYDKGGLTTSMYGVSGFPTTYMYSPDGSVFGYLPGYADADVLDNAIADANK